jgi:hypothetical protein
MRNGTQMLGLGPQSKTMCFFKDLGLDEDIKSLEENGGKGLVLFT